MSSTDAWPGTVLNSTYRIVRLIRTGGMGSVYEAENVRLPNLRYAIKVVPPQEESAGGDAEQFYGRFVREAEILSGLRHPNIVTVLDFNRTERGHPYLVMELLQGEDLAAWLVRRGTLPLDMVASLVTQVGGALQFAHDLGVVHRDLKPSNVFLATSPVGPPQVKLLDFGLSKTLDGRWDITRVDVAILGTADFMSPEQAAGALQRIDHQSDIFSFASVVYACLTGRRPFPGKSDPETRRRVREADPRPPSSIVPVLPGAVDQVIARAHAKQKARRYREVRDFVADLLAALGEDAPGAEETERPQDASAAGDSGGVAATVRLRRRGNSDVPGAPSAPEHRGWSIPSAADPGAERSPVQDDPAACLTEERTEEYGGSADEREAALPPSTREPGDGEDPRDGAAAVVARAQEDEGRHADRVREVSEVDAVADSRARAAIGGRRVPLVLALAGLLAVVAAVVAYRLAAGPTPRDHVLGGGSDGPRGATPGPRSAGPGSARDLQPASPDAGGAGVAGPAVGRGGSGRALAPGASGRGSTPARRLGDGASGQRGGSASTGARRSRATKKLLIYEDL